MSDPVQLQQSDFEGAVFSIFRHFDLVEAGGRLLTSNLEDKWSYSGMRIEDLRSALVEMVDAGVLRMERTSHGMAFVLTEMGATYLSEYRESPSTRIALFRASKRERSGPVNYERRESN